MNTDMKIRNYLLILAAICLLQGTAQAQSLNSVLKAHYKSMRFDALGEVSTQSTQGKIVMMGAELPLKMYKKRPGKLRIEGDFMGNKFIQTINGSEGWQIAPWSGSTTPKAMDSKQKDQFGILASLEGPLYGYEQQGFAADYKGTTQLDGKEVYHITLTKDGELSNHYIDKSTHYLHAITSTTEVNGKMSSIKLVFRDYKMVSGFPIAHQIDTYAGTQAVFSLIFNQVSLNETIADALFEK